MTEPAQCPKCPGTRVYQLRFTTTEPTNERRFHCPDCQWQGGVEDLQVARGIRNMQAVMTEPATSQGEHDWHQKLAEDKFEMAMQIVKLGGQLDAERARADAMRSALEEMERTLTSPSRQLLDSTRRELEPWLLLIQAALASAPGKSTADELRRLREENALAKAAIYVAEVSVETQQMMDSLKAAGMSHADASLGIGFRRQCQKAHAALMEYRRLKAAQPPRAERSEL